MRVNYENQSKPLIDALVKIESTRSSPPQMMVTIEQARAMGFDVPNFEFDIKNGPGRVGKQLHRLPTWNRLERWATKRRCPPGYCTLPRCGNEGRAFASRKQAKPTPKSEITDGSGMEFVP